jgi:hypothetical protein
LNTVVPVPPKTGSDTVTEHPGSAPLVVEPVMQIESRSQVPVTLPPQAANERHELKGDEPPHQPPTELPPDPGLHARHSAIGIRAGALHRSAAPIPRAIMSDTS